MPQIDSQGAQVFRKLECWFGLSITHLC